MASPKRTARPSRTAGATSKSKGSRAATPRRAARPAVTKSRPDRDARPDRADRDARPDRGPGTPPPDVTASDPSLFAPLTPGEIADAVRTLTEDRRLTAMAKVGRYRVVATEPLVVKPPHWITGHRLARVVVYDYAADRCVDACVDLDAGVVAHLELTRAQPMLSREEEADAIAVATADDQVRDKLTLGDAAMCAMHYWGTDATDPAFARRSAAVIFGQHGAAPTWVAVVDLVDNQVTAVVPAAQW